MDIQAVETDDVRELTADHGRQMRKEIHQTFHLQALPFSFALFFENKHLVFDRTTALHPVRVRCQPTTYPNYSRCSISTNICYAYPNQCQCEGLHSLHFDFECIMIILTEYVSGGR